MSYYPPYRSSSNNIKIELGFSNYATKDDVKKVEDKVNENKKEIIFVRGFFLYEYHSDLVYDCKLNLIKTHIHGILDWNPKNIYDPSNKNMLNSVQNINLLRPNIRKYENGGFYLTIDNIKSYFSLNKTALLKIIFPNDYQKNKYHQVWKEIFKIVDNENGELNLHEKIVLSGIDIYIYTDEIIKISSVTIVIK